jgi:hypothetical protein
MSLAVDIPTYRSLMRAFGSSLTRQSEESAQSSLKVGP